MVIGASGFLGGQLCTELAAGGAQVLRASSSAGTGIDPATGLLPADFCVPPATDAVVYLAQSPYSRRMPEMASHFLGVNTFSPADAAVRAAAAGAKRFVYASTGNVYQPSFAPLKETAQLRRDNWYALSKIHAEETLALMQGVIDVTSVRIFGLYGPGQTERLIPRLVDAVASAQPVMLEPKSANAAPDGGLRISLLHVRDAARIIVALIGVRAVPLLNLASDEALDIREISSLIGERLGVAPIYRAAPAARQGDMIADIGLLQRSLAPSFTSFRAGVRDLIGTSTRANVGD
jgi:nucleoside-diphosphate-sugar epimerase